MYLDAMVGDHRDDAELVGLIEPNPGRLSVHLKRLSDAGLEVSSVVTGHPDDLERVIKETEADRAIITSPDYTHAELIVRSLDAGVDVVVLEGDHPALPQALEEDRVLGLLEGLRA